ncbi:diaminopimelate epimerase [Candidatus Woesearchaeota archaeon]|nr:diaminopimelate epimerase [Candidatus Woesearchaeota archaeon]
MKFTKMHVNGNDFVLVDGINEQVPEDYQDIAKEICDRHMGVGSGGVIFILKSQKADFLIEAYKPDSSEPKISANSVLCASRYAYDNKIVQKNSFRVETKARVVDVSMKDDKITVDIGEPVLETKKIPATIDKERMINEQIKLKDRIIRATCMSLGNPHCVVFVEDLAKYPVEEEGPIIENHEEFPRKTNVEFVQILNDKEIRVRPWKRVVGETLGCGTGSCAALVASVLNKKTGKKVLVHAKGGDVEVEWKENNHLLITANPVYIFKGEIELG